MAKAKISDQQQVEEYMQKLDHPLKAEIEQVRSILKLADLKLQERVKWNATSYHLDNVDLVTFNNRNPKLVHLVFHHPNIVNISSKLLQGDYKDRRMMYFSSMQEVEADAKELNSIICQLIRSLEN